MQLEFWEIVVMIGVFVVMLIIGAIVLILGNLILGALGGLIG